MNEKYTKRINIDPKIMIGKPVIKGTRITVELILRLLAQGLTMQEILKNYPHLEMADIYAAIGYANELVQEQAVFPINQTHEKTKTAVR